MKPRKRWSYKIFLVVLACASLPEALPFLKDQVPQWVFGLLAVLGIAAQHIKQEITSEQSERNSE